jgi:hypothetical protein
MSTIIDPTIRQKLIEQLALMGGNTTDKNKFLNDKIDAAKLDEILADPQVKKVRDDYHQWNDAVSHQEKVSAFKDIGVADPASQPWFNATADGKGAPNERGPLFRWIASHFSLFSGGTQPDQYEEIGIINGVKVYKRKGS